MYSPLFINHSQDVRKSVELNGGSADFIKLPPLPLEIFFHFSSLPFSFPTAIHLYDEALDVGVTDGAFNVLMMDLMIDVLVYDAVVPSYSNRTSICRRSSSAAQANGDHHR